MNLLMVLIGSRKYFLVFENFNIVMNHLTGGGKLSGNSADLAANLASTIDPSMFLS